jgi:glycogen debranching enzyme
MKEEWNMLSLTDLVFNHTANESPWLLEHPECSYNMINSPHLKPAYLVDRILWHFSLEVSEGKWDSNGVPAELKTEAQLQVIS